MNKVILFCCCLLIAGRSLSQNNAINPYPKTITVSGSAEMEFVPDQIFVTIELREYQKKNEPKHDLEAIKSAFLDACKAASIADSVISITSYTGYNNYYYFRKSKKDPNLLTGIIYQVIFSNSKQMDDLVQKLDDEATKSFEITGTSHTNIREFRKQVKTQAIKAAKDKAIYLTDAIGEKLGPAITIVEPDESGYNSIENNRLSNSMNMISQARISRDENNDQDKTEVAFKKIKLRYEVNVVFSL